MAIADACTAPGCTTLTIGPFCIAHDIVVPGEFSRGRPYPPPARVIVASATRSAVAESPLRFSRPAQHRD
jgi:hypothetical protein